MNDIRELNFNKLFIIESLEPTERETGKELHNDLLRYKDFQLDNFSAEYVSIGTKDQFIKKLKAIEKSCKEDNIFPMIHFEIHGSENGSGLILVSGELIKWSELYEYLISINIIIKNNLFVTLAVCKGAYLMEVMNPTNPTPFWGFIGSFEKIYNDDLYIRYYEFYNELLTSFDMNKAINSLRQANTPFPDTYKFISSELLFDKIYLKYSNEQTKGKGLIARTKQIQIDENLNFDSRTERRKFERKFKKQVILTKYKFYNKYKNQFLMID